MSVMPFPPATLLIISGIAEEREPLSTRWRQQIEKAVYDALPICMIRLDPLPMISLQVERRWRPELQMLVKTLQEQDDPSALLTVWSTFFASDPSIGESFLLICTAGSAARQWTLRFQHACHWQMLEAIERSGQIALVAASGREPVILRLAQADLHLHLDRIRAYQRNPVAEQV